MTDEEIKRLRTLCDVWLQEAKHKRLEARQTIANAEEIEGRAQMLDMELDDILRKRPAQEESA